LLFPGQQIKLDQIQGCISDLGILMYVHPESVAHNFPVFTILKRGGTLSGPVLISHNGTGLTQEQVSLVRNEVFFVDGSIRATVAAIWWHAWNTLDQRGWC
jgi:hypothetical protein